MFIHCHSVVIDGVRMKIVCTVLLKYGQHLIHFLSIEGSCLNQNNLSEEREREFWFLKRQ